MRAVGLGLLLLAAPALADELPGDVQHYVDRREYCNYWTTERGDNSHRRIEIERHVRELNCKTLAHDEAVLRARYAGKAPIGEAMDAAQDAFPPE